ncbi:5-hydroxytryptamine receptor 4-like [Portunus trituberculatus]|uniref:5-hydroxytryptamine receptor 4-like n=1 Tax=Portunus trituberculatus TaxID=210409 RepID=UPI001E1CDFC4|nr:5-hydroxytryptamine receptor 4-like [Portunus trituberculatus]XP_045108750.1 5-hydroxytryptamine receptor 4-like [Portunus trituberculatus]XP_045108751.1 5-hydroxytryptamine receptor 4-like [Portunus trituberculatus]XP_045108752.1 5-hydroxytryptamine receptor 4-like [Portunus trituberculatus]
MSLNMTAGGGEARDNSSGSSGTDQKLLIYMVLSLATVAECVLAGHLTLTSHELRRRRATLISICLVFTIGILSSLSLVYVVVLLTVPGATYRSPAGCRVRVAQRYLSVVSCFTLACLSLDRYLAICWPLRYQDLLTKTRCHLLCGACWVLPALLLLLPCIPVLGTMCEKSRTEECLLVAYVVAYTLGAFATFVLYVLVALEFRQNIYSCNSASAQATGDAHSREVAVVRHRTAKSALTVLMLYTVLSLPHTLLPVVARIHKGSIPKEVQEIGYLVHRFHLLLFLPMYAGTNAFFLASLSAWGKLLWRRCICWGAAFREIARNDSHDPHAHQHTQDDLL